jgi:hypothetical protein
MSIPEKTFLIRPNPKNFKMIARWTGLSAAILSFAACVEKKPTAPVPVPVEPCEGHHVLTVMADEGPRADCPLGSRRFHVGIDWNDDGTLDASEIDPTTTLDICNEPSSKSVGDPSDAVCNPQ